MSEETVQFVEMVREAAAQPEPIKIWSFCPFCWVRTEQVFEREDARFEYYRCSCGQLRPVAVR